MLNKKIIIYQVFTRLYGNRITKRKPNGTLAENGSGKFADFDENTLKHFRDMGISHVWYTGVIRHATQTDYSANGIPTQHPAVVKGKAGSPYAICDYYDVDPDLATDVDKRMKEFEALIKRTHKAGLKVIMDFVPNHVARQYKSIAKPKGVKDLGADDNSNDGFNPQNNFYYCPGCRLEPTFDIADYEEFPAKSTGNDHFDNHPGKNDWYETVKLNYGKDYWTGCGHFDPIPDTWSKMTDILLFWAKKGVDGFRCDMAEMVPSAFWAWATDKICGMTPANAITGAWQATDDIKKHMLYFLENHDEQRVASDYFAGDAKKGIPGLVASVLMQGNPFMLYAAEEYGERGMDEEGFSGKDGRTTIFDYWSIDTLCRADKGKLKKQEKEIYALHEKVMQIARSEKAVDGETYDLMYVNNNSDCFDAARQYAFLRKKDDEMLLVVCNFSDKKVNVSVNIPKHAFEWLSIPEKDYEATDLLSDEKMAVTLKADSGVKMTVPAFGARVIKVQG